jgi:uroporphyrinogen-III synthase
MKLLVTRPAAQAAQWVAQLQARGVDAVALPLIGIAPPTDGAAVVAAWATLATQRLVVFVSPNAVEHFFAARPTDLRWPVQTLAGSTGNGTTQALLAAGVPAAQLVAPPRDAPQFDSEALWRVIEARDWQAAPVLIVRGDGGRDWLADTLRGRGALVRHLTAYRRVVPQLAAAERLAFEAALAAPQRQLWLFSSSEAIATLVDMAPGQAWQAARAIATHPRIAETARAAGFGEVTLASPAVDAVVACIQSLPPPKEP